MQEWEASLDALQPGGGSVCYSHKGGPVCVPDGARLVFVGDSTIRYLWLSFAYALRHGEENQADGINGTRSIVHERSWWTTQPWADFFRGTTEALAPHALCDCTRELQNPRKSMLNSVEHRYFHYRNVSLSFISWTGQATTRGFWWPKDPIDSCYAPAVHNVVGQRRHWDIRWNRPWMTAISDVLQELRPSIVLFGSPNHHLGTSYSRAFTLYDWAKLSRSLALVASRVLWITPTHVREGGSRKAFVGELRDAEQLSQIFGADGIFDARGLTAGAAPEDYWPGDDVHFSAPMNNLLVRRLVQQLFAKLARP